jgi:hypothetical protein
MYQWGNKYLKIWAYLWQISTEGEGDCVESIFSNTFLTLKW